ncbi:CYTH domain-containing protein [bacterium]|jgi:adenylate cyclase, class 2|nr:CYTH domain-containing protein [bacterium]MBT6293393.1 CYTH domain-containing protein [bacterium]
MKTEFEATFSCVDHEQLRKKFNDLGASLVQKEFIQIRSNFNLPTANKNAFVRVRKENDKITLTLKVFEDNDSIHRQKEVELKIDSFEEAISFLEFTGFKQKNFQETKRELWEIDGCQIMLDTWPFLDPFIEIESINEENVKKLSQKLGFNYIHAIFDSVDYQYAKKYNISRDKVNQTKILSFNSKNPFIKKN